MNSRRQFLQMTALGVACFKLRAEPPDIVEATFAQLQQGWTSAQLVDKYLERIDQIDKRGPRLNSVIELNPDAPAIARALDAERKEKGLRGPLHGLPILIKDNIDTADKMMTTAGSLALVGAPTPPDAGIVVKLRAAGAVILGKTNLSEWANLRSSHSTSGWSGRGGQTHNPYALDRNPSGSSSGSGAAAAASLCAAAVGTETDGSVVSPSSLQGLVGIKPTVGLLSGAGIVPISHRQDTAGPMARTVTDAALLLGAMAGKDYRAALEPNGLKGARIGIARQIFGFNDHVDRAINASIDVLKQLGAVVVDPADIPTFSKLSEPENDALLWEFKADLSAYLAKRGGEVRSLADVIEFNRHNREREMPYFDEDLMDKALKKGPLTSPKYRLLVARLNQLSQKDGIDAIMAKHRLDALFAPTDGPAWPTDFIDGDHFGGGSSTPPAIAGYPHVTVPAAQVFGLPIGASFFGASRTEAKLIKYAYAFEQATKARRAPDYRPTAVISAAG
jgi:amidase